MAYIHEKSEAEDAPLESKWEIGEKKGNRAVMSPNVIYDVAENKQAWVLVSPICNHLWLSLSEGTHTLWWVAGAKLEEIMFRA